MSFALPPLDSRSKKDKKRLIFHCFSPRLNPALADPSFQDFLASWHLAHQHETSSGSTTFATTASSAAAAIDDDNDADVAAAAADAAADANQYGPASSGSAQPCLAHQHTTSSSGAIEATPASAATAAAAGDDGQRCGTASSGDVQPQGVVKGVSSCSGVRRCVCVFKKALVGVGVGVVAERVSGCNDGGGCVCVCYARSALC